MTTAAPALESSTTARIAVTRFDPVRHPLIRRRYILTVGVETSRLRHERRYVSHESPRVTVVIPTQNRWRFARTAIWSVLAQQGASARLVVVDDASDDDTPERLATLRHPAVAALRQPRKLGVSAARNRGLSEVTTECVAFLDDDDVWAPFHLARLLDAIRDSGLGASAELAYSSVVTTDGDRRPTGIKAAP